MVPLIVGIVFLVLYAVGRAQAWVRWLVTVFLVLGIILTIVGVVQLVAC
jgi:hypothetical protein